jgi:UDP-2,3-diacylglucosamine hydrolase
LNKKIYFASDFHLGVPNLASSLEREKRIVQWLDQIRNDAEEIFLVGDLFDFWFEYKHVIPKGFTRLLGKLAELADSGIRIHLFHGNHDLWQFGYLEQEIGCIVHTKPITIERSNKKFYIAHGDGLGPGQFRFKLILSIYRNRFFQRLFAFFHPYIGMSLAHWFSHQSKLQTFESNNTYLGDDKEYLMQHAQTIARTEQIDYCIFGHRHLAFYKMFNNTAVINLGDWFQVNTYAVFDGTDVKLYKNENIIQP